MANKSLQHFTELSRQPISNHFRKALLETGKPPLNRLQIFERNAFWAWINSYVEYAFQKKHVFLDASAAPNNSNSKYTIPDLLRISLAGDWGSGTLEAELVANQMMNWSDGGNTDLTVHLGDVYYVGDETEIRENCLGGDGVSNPKADVIWPVGSKGSLALNGNHEMYANGDAYFKTFLPRLGIRNNSTDSMPGQGPSFFCLENNNWRIVGIDTGYNSVGKPIIGIIPGFRPNCELDPLLINWLQNIVKPQNNPKATILLSHHQYFSAFEEDYPKPAEQLAPFFKNQTVLWLWGHEHRVAGYKQADTGQFKFHGRCIGHGGMPVEPAEPNGPHINNLWFYDSRKNLMYGNDGLGYNGFAQLNFSSKDLKVSYYTLSTNVNKNSYDLNPMLILEEAFTASGSDVRSNGIVNNPQIAGIEVTP